MSEVIRVMDDIDFAADPVEDLEVRLASLQAAGHRVVPVRYSGQTAWIILRYDDLAETFLNEQQLPAAPFYERMAMPAQGRTLLAMKGEQHRLNRALVAGAPQPAPIRRCVESLLIPTANRLIDAFAAPGPLDLVAAYTHPYPFRIISGMLGIPVSDERHLLELTNLLFKFPTEPERALAARAEISAYL